MTRISWTHRGHTHVYCYGPGDEAAALTAINEHVAIGRVLPVAGILLCEMIEEGEGES